MSRRAYIYFALTFLLGVVLGGTCVYYYAWSTGRWRPAFNRQSFVQRLKNELRLSDEQMPKLEQIVDGSTTRVRTTQQQCDAQLNAIRQETRSQIRQILTPEQSPKFEELVRRWDERRRRASH